MQVAQQVTFFSMRRQSVLKCPFISQPLNPHSHHAVRPLEGSRWIESPEGY
jgi:hypothetical protein